MNDKLVPDFWSIYSCRIVFLRSKRSGFLHEDDDAIPVAQLA